MGYDFDFGYGAVPNPADIASQARDLFLVMMGIYFLLMVYSIVAYVMGSLGSYTIAMRRGIKHPWLAFVPFGNLWILGSISDQYQYVSQGQIRSNRKVLLGLQIAGAALGLVVFGIYIKMVLDMFAIIDTNPYMLDMTVAAGSLVGLSLAIVLIGFAALVLAIIQLVFYYIALYNLYASCLPKCKVVFILLSILLLSLPDAFLIFGCRKQDRGMPPRKDAPVEAIEAAAPVAEPVVEPVEEPVVESVEEPVVETEAEPEVAPEAAPEAEEEAPAAEE